jgi:GTP-binding protein
VGKSLLFNRLTRTKTSIVDDTPGVTRDRIYGECNWRGRDFVVIDTGGIEPHTGDEMLKFMRRQAQLAIDSADVIILITDIKSGVTAADVDVSVMLLHSGKPIVLCVNKIDGVGEPPPDFYEFYGMGLGEPVALSALHGHGTGDMLDRCWEHFPDEDEAEDESELIKVAVIGKPNSGKSSLVNCILGEERVIVSDIAGTTRDAIDTSFENEYGKYVIIDTAGMRRKARVDEDIERYSVIRSLMAIERSDVCLIMIDANDGVTEQDTKIAGLAHQKGKACIIVVNKWDLVEKDDKTMDKMEKRVRSDLAYMSYAPIIFISAKTGQRVPRLFEMISAAFEMSSLRITTGALNEVLRDAVMRVQPPTDKGKRLKVYYITQTGIRPPHFVLFCNDEELFHFSYKRYIENSIRGVYGLTGTPVKMTIREREE